MIKAQLIETINTIKPSFSIFFIIVLWRCYETTWKIRSRVFIYFVVVFVIDSFLMLQHLYAQPRFSRLFLWGSHIFFLINVFILILAPLDFLESKSSFLKAFKKLKKALM